MTRTSSRCRRARTIRLRRALRRGGPPPGPGRAGEEVAGQRGRTRQASGHLRGQTLDEHDRRLVARRVHLQLALGATTTNTEAFTMELPDCPAEIAVENAEVVA